MNKSELVSAIAADTKLTKKDVELAVKSFVDTVSKALEKGDDVQLVGFGTFTVVDRAERKSINPATKQEIIVPASKSPKFKPGKALKDLVNKK